MFGRRSTSKKIDAVDQAFDLAEANARKFGAEVAAHITREFKAGSINRNGIDAWVELALEQTANQAVGIPKSMVKAILTTLHTTIRQELGTAGITIPELKP